MQGAPLELFPLFQSAPTLSGTWFPTTKCAKGVLREKREVSRPFSKVDEVEDHPYHLGEVAFGSLWNGEDTLESSS